MNNVMTAILGPSWKTSLFGLCGGFLYYFSQAGVALPQDFAGWKQALVAAGIFAWGRIQKDHDQTGAAAPPAK